MRVWLITIGEPLPSDGPAPRLLRTGILAQMLAAAGHEVVWWSSTFNHTAKQHRFTQHTTIHGGDRLTLKLLHGGAYRKNISVRRFLNHRSLARQFRSLAPHEDVPDVILCSLPPVELCSEATRYGTERDVPVVLDVRDLYPDIFVNVVPFPLRTLGRFMMGPMFRSAGRALRECTAIAGVSKRYLDWGLSKAGRVATDRDRVFPLGYRTPNVSAHDVTGAMEALAYLGVDESKLICWFIGVFGKTYDLATVLDAADMLVRAGRDDVQLVLSGDGEDRVPLERRHPGIPNVVFTGWIDSPLIAAMMRISDVGLAAYAPGAPQGLPNKLFEFMCAGLPIISSLPDEAADLLHVNRCGVLYEAGNAGSLAKRIAEMVEDSSLRKEMGANARQLFEKRFAADHIYQEFIDYLGSLSRSTTRM